MSLLIDKPGPLRDCAGCGHLTWRDRDWGDYDDPEIGFCEWCVRINGLSKPTIDGSEFGNRPPPPESGQLLLPLLVPVPSWRDEPTVEPKVAAS